jgi:RNA polymerase sigma-70 factor, ECF subfamily
MTDAELVRKSLGGCRESYAEISRRWVPRIMAICHSRVRNSHVAEDLAQETLLRGYRALGTLSDHTKIGSWLMGIALRACLDWLKAKERTTIPFSGLRPEQSLDQLLAEEPVDIILHADDRKRLISEVESLPEIYRQVVMLYYYEDLTYRDLANLLGVSSATINARLTRARSLLRERLTQCEQEERI